MRTSTLTIRGTEYPCCFSTRVLLALEDRGKREKPVKSATEMLSSIMENEALSDAFWLLHQLMVAGNRYAKLEGLDAPEVFSLDDMIDLVGVEDYPAMFAAIGKAVTDGQAQTVEAETPRRQTCQTDRSVVFMVRASSWLMPGRSPFCSALGTARPHRCGADQIRGRTAKADAGRRTG